jgi:hypothetical protein
MNTASLFAKPQPAPDPRLLALRRTSPLCIETPQRWHQHHSWQRRDGRIVCKVCTVPLLEAP